MVDAWDLQPVTPDLIGKTILLGHDGSTYLREYRIVEVRDHRILAKDAITLNLCNFELASTECVWVAV